MLGDDVGQRVEPRFDVSRLDRLHQPQMPFLEQHVRPPRDHAQHREAEPLHRRHDLRRMALAADTVQDHAFDRHVGSIAS